MLREMSLEQFGEVLGSAAPAPGGGSVAALSGALAANLVAMVCRLSIGKEGYAEFADSLNPALSKADDLAAELLGRVDLDTEAFNSVMSAFKLPKETIEDKETRSKAIQEGYKDAVQSPIAIARECVEVLLLCRELLGKSNANALSDLGVASQQAYAGLEGAIMNIKINLPSIKDTSFNSAIESEIKQLLKEGHGAKEEVYDFMSDAL